MRPDVHRVTTALAPAVAWRWPLALLGAVCAVPAAVVTISDPSRGLALALGVLPATAVGVTGARRTRIRIVVVGVAIGAGLALGAMLAQHWALAIGGLFVLCLGAAVLASSRPVGRLLLVLAVPMVGAGLSFHDVPTALELAALMAIGSVYGWLVALCWPEPATVHSQLAPMPPRSTMIEYGLRLGVAGSLCAAVGFAFDLDHKGWATAACLLVMRPTAEMTRLRAAGRAIAVSAGALAAGLLAGLGADPALIALAVVGDLTALAATRPSRWYVTGAFSTLLVLLLLVYGTPSAAESRVDERVWETFVGVGVALVLGSVVPAVRSARGRS